MQKLKQLTKLTCPECKQAVKKVLFEGGAVCCPHCKHVMFQYRLPDEQLKRAEFMALLNQDRGAAAGVAAAKWFPALGHKLAVIRGGFFIAYVWPHLAGTFDA